MQCLPPDLLTLCIVATVSHKPFLPTNNPDAALLVPPLGAVSDKVFASVLMYSDTPVVEWYVQMMLYQAATLRWPTKCLIDVFPLSQRRDWSPHLLLIKRFTFFRLHGVH